MSEADLDTLFSRLVDGDLDANDFATLQSRLQESPEARAAYLEWIDLHNVLDLDLSPPAAPMLRSGLAAPVEHILRRQQKRSLAFATLAAAAALAVVAVVFKLILVPKAEPALRFQVVEGTLFQVIHPDADGEPADPGTLELGARLTLEDGAVEFNLPSGVRSIVRGPATLSLEATDQLRLENGSAWFHVPPEARGFKVRTPGTTIVDLGTEFGVISRPDTLDEVHLFRGRIRIENRHGLRRTETLEGANVARVTGPAGRFREIEARKRDFLTALPATLLDSYPHIHWSFDGEHPLEANGSHPDVREGDTRAEGGTMPQTIPGPVGRALEFEGTGGAVLTSNWQGILGNKARTVACWVRLFPNDPKGWSAIVEWGRESTNASSIWRARVAPAEGPGASRSVLRVGFGLNWLEGETEVADGTWHHLAIVQSEETDHSGFPVVQLYVDGREEKLTYLPNASIARPVETRPGQPLRIAPRLPKDSKLRGGLDELYVIEAALNPATIRRIMAAGSP